MASESAAGVVPAPGGDRGAGPARPRPPFGRRLCAVTESRASGGYRLFSLRDEEGPEPLPGQFYMLATERGWGEDGGRPFLPRALSVAGATPAPRPHRASNSDAVRGLGGLRLDFLVEAIGPGTRRLCALEPGERVWVNGPLGNGFAAPQEVSPGAAGAILVGGGIGIAPLALLRRRFAERSIPTRVLLGFRDAAHSGGLEDLFACCEVGLASEDGQLGQRGYVTELLEAMLAGDDAASAAVYACGPEPMLEAVAALCAARGAACELAMEAPMACGFGACHGCAVPSGDGGYTRLCLEGPVVNASQLLADRFRPAGPVAAGDPPPPAVAEASSGAVPPTAPPAGETPTSDAAPRNGTAAAGGERGASNAPPAGGVGFGVPSASAESAEGEARSLQPISSRCPEQIEAPGGHPNPATGPAGRGATVFCGIELAHPVINASGTFDAIAARGVYGDAVLEEFPFAAFVSKTITLEPRAGNEPPRLWETPAGMLNSIGLPNRGLEGFLAEELPRLAELPVPLIVSVMGTSREQFARLVEGLAGREEVAALELNVSCPNVESGLIVGEEPQEAAALLEALRPLTPKPLIVKLTPNVTDPCAVALAAEAAGADAVSLVNTLKASAFDPFSGRPGVAAGQGGLSGPALRPVAVAQVRAAAAAVSVPVVGMGGVCEGADVLEMIRAGATLAAVGTESFRDPRAGRRISSELLEQASRLKLDSRSR
jgi:dihydroorotate dehydrogenase (NAD+) catalytic subunit